MMRKQILNKKSIIKEIFENIECEEKDYLSMALEKEIKDTLEKNNTAISTVKSGYSKFPFTRKKIYYRRKFIIKIFFSILNL